MIKSLPISAALAFALASSQLSGNIAFFNGLQAYNSAFVVTVPSASVTAASNQIFLRDPRAVLQTFQVGDDLELTGINFIVRRALEGSQFTLTLRDFGTTAPGNSLTPSAVSGATSLASFSHTVTSEQVFGNASGAVNANDPFNTMTWTLATSVNLVPGRIYGVVFDGTNITTGVPHIIASYALGNPFAGGMGFYQDGNTNNFRTDVFGEGNNQQVDFALSLIPEPSTYAMLTGLAVLALVIVRGRRSA